MMGALVSERPQVAEAAELSELLPPQGFPGIAHDIDIDVYHSMPGISKTGLDAINRSPAHYYGWHLDPMRPERGLRGGQLEGSLAHCAVLEPSEFPKRYAITPPNAPRKPGESQWNAKSPGPASVHAMNWWKDFKESNPGKTIITAAQYETAMRQAQSMRKLPQVAEALERGKPEVTAMWIDPMTGEPCRCRPDWVSDFGARRVVLLDVKTYSDASAGEFARQIARKRYHVQDAFYSDGYASATGCDVLAFMFVAVEGEFPYQANALMLKPTSREQGRVDYRRNLATYSACRKRGEWPGYGSEIQLIDLPRYALDRELRDLDLDDEYVP